MADENQLQDSGELSFFSERYEVLKAIKSICDGAELSLFSVKFDWLVIVLGKYQEQPTLLNPYLFEMMNPLTTKVLDIAMDLDSTRIEIFVSHLRQYHMIEVFSFNLLILFITI